MRNFLNEPTNIDFLKIRKYAYIFSFVIFIGSIALMFTKGFNLGLDFTGGTSIQVKFKNPVNIGELRKLLASVGLDDALIQEIGTEKVEYEIRVSVKKGSSTEILRKVKEALNEKFKDKYEIRKVEFIGSIVGEELRKASIYSIVAVLLAILIYVGYRFEPIFAVASVVPLFHDAIITMGVFSLLGMEVNLSVIAAILTVLGYSLNDTIIIFDRRGKRDLVKLINRSINENLSRTIITSGTTLFAVVTLYLFGGESLKGFSFALLIGVIVGTYSSIYVAAPLIIELERMLRGNRKVKTVET